jgi:hypothetical protein
MRVIHRPDEVFHHAGFEAKNYTNLTFNRRFGCPAAANLEMLETLINAILENPLLLHDAYFTVNGIFGFNEKVTHQKVPLPRGLLSRKKNLQWANGCFVDLDIYKTNPPLDPYQAEGELLIMVGLGEIPAPSIIAHSGRGLYVVWLLRNAGIEDEEGDKAFSNPPLPEHATPRNVARSEAINRQLVKCLERFSADSRATNANRILRLPGSFHTIAQRKVEYTIRYRGDGVLYYTLEELERELGMDINSPAFTQTTRATKNPGSAPKRINGYRALHRKRLAKLRAIFLYRGGIRKREQKYDDGNKSSGRRRFLIHVATACYGSGKPRDEALKICEDFARNCKPAYPGEDDPVSVKAIVHEAYKTPPWCIRDETFLKFFGISPTVAEQIGVAPTPKPKNTGAAALAQELREKRRDFIWGYIQAHGPTSARRMEDICEAHGFNASPPTIRKDLRVLQIVEPPSSPVTVLGLSKQQDEKTAIEAQANLEQRRAQRERETRRIVAPS